jgi:hypothetical protein
LKRGSFHEIISILFNNPLIASIVGASIVTLLEHLLKRKKDDLSSGDVNIDNLINNYYLIKNINQIVIPLEKDTDTVKIISSNPSVNISINQDRKKILKETIRELKEQIAIEIYEEEFFGYLSVIYLDKEKYRFTLEGTDKSIPAEFDQNLSLDKIREIIGMRLKIKAHATYEEKELKKLDISNYEIKRRINLNDFSKKV